jgi:spermidine synthase
LSWFDETLHAGYHQRLEIERVLFESKTGHQELVIFENSFFGRVLALDGIVQTTERDEFFYHEMLVHVPVLAHGNAKRVLIIGGGDGGSLREVLRHPVDTATLVELDRTVIDLCREYMPALGNGAFDDPRTELIIGDGLKFVAETERMFDVIIVDSTDPVGPGAVLFTAQFYRDCKRCLAAGGVLVTQNGVPFFQGDEVRTTWMRLGRIFGDVGFYTVPVPTYVGGPMTLGWATDNPELRRTRVETLADRYRSAGLQTRYYTAEVHVAAFALPPYITDLMG